MRLEPLVDLIEGGGKAVHRRLHLLVEMATAIFLASVREPQRIAVLILASRQDVQ